MPEHANSSAGKIFDVAALGRNLPTLLMLPAFLALFLLGGSTAAIAVYSWLGVPDIWPLYAFITINSVAAASMRST